MFCPSPRPLQPGAKFQTSKQKRPSCRDGEVGGLWGTGAGAGTPRKTRYRAQLKTTDGVCIRLHGL